MPLAGVVLLPAARALLAQNTEGPTFEEGASVVLVGGPNGARVVHRRGYYSPGESSAPAGGPWKAPSPGASP